MRKITVKSVYNRKYYIGLYKLRDGRYQVEYKTSNMAGIAKFNFGRMGLANDLFDAKLMELSLQYT